MTVSFIQEAPHFSKAVPLIELAGEGLLNRPTHQNGPLPTE